MGQDASQRTTLRSDEPILPRSAPRPVGRDWASLSQKGPSLPTPPKRKSRTANPHTQNSEFGGSDSIKLTSLPGGFPGDAVSKLVRPQDPAESSCAGWPCFLSLLFLELYCSMHHNKIKHDQYITQHLFVYTHLVHH